MKKLFWVLGLFLVVSSVVYAEDGNVFQCAEEQQLNGMVLTDEGRIDNAKSNRYKILWHCPVLPNVKGDKYDISHKLFDVDFKDGYYNCQYSYKSNGKYIKNCTYQSILYKRMKSEIKSDLYGKVDSSGKVTGGLYDSYNTFGKVFIFPILNKMGVATDAQGVKGKGLGGLQLYFADVYKKIKEEEDNLNNSKSGALYGVGKYIKDINELAYEYLEKPYIVPDGQSEVRKGNTFSNFVAGIITIDSDIIEGYNERTGEIKINQSWKEAAASISVEDRSDVEGDGHHWYSGIISFFTDEDQAEEAKKGMYDKFIKTIGDGKLALKVTSWIEIFELKLWGYYYNLQRKLDFGYDMIAKQLFFFMAVWFVLLGGTKMAVSYTLNKENKLKESEGAWLKTMAVLMGITVFYISLPQPVSSDNVVSIDTTEEMKKNKTLMKGVIRQGAQMGANFANMLADLGLRAYLDYFISAQQLYSVTDIKEELEESGYNFYMYFPAKDIVEQCRAYYVATDAEFYRTQNHLKLDGAINKNWGSSEWSNSKNLDALSYPVCKKAYQIFGMGGYDLALSASEANEKLENANELMAKATYQFSLNHIAMQDKVGWVGSFMIPVNYLIMKNNDLFLTKGVDYEKVKENAEGIVAANTRGGEILTDDARWASITDSAAKGTGLGLSYLSNLMLYNILPAFSPIQQGIQKYFDNVYGDIIETDGKTSGLLSYLDEIKGSMALGGWMKVLLSKAMPSSHLAWRTFILVGSFVAAIFAWKIMFKVIFISSISMIMIFKVLDYFKDLFVHWMSSLFIFLWAFTKAGGQGEAKMVNFIKDTVAIVILQPSLIVVGGFMFVFLYELMTILYVFIMQTMVSSERMTVSLMGIANDNAGFFDKIGAYMNLNSIELISGILVDVVAFFIAIRTVLKFPEYVLRKFGLSDQETFFMHQSTTEITKKTEGVTDPVGGGR